MLSVDFSMRERPPIRCAPVPGSKASKSGACDFEVRFPFVFSHILIAAMICFRWLGAAEAVSMNEEWSFHEWSNYFLFGECYTRSRNSIHNAA